MVAYKKIDIMFKKKIIILDSVGFDSMGDFLSNILVSKYLLVFSGIFVAAIGYVDRFIEMNIYSPAKGIYILFLVTVFDILLGISVAIKDKSFDSYRFNRAWIRLVVQIVIVGLLNQSNIVWELVNDWMVNTLLLAFVLTTLWSAFKNANKLKWVQSETFLILERILGIEDIFNKFVKGLFKNDLKKNKKDKK